MPIHYTNVTYLVQVKGSSGFTLSSIKVTKDNVGSCENKLKNETFQPLFSLSDSISINGSQKVTLSGKITLLENSVKKDVCYE